MLNKIRHGICGSTAYDIELMKITHASFRCSS